MANVNPITTKQFNQNKKHITDIHWYADNVLNGNVQVCKYIRALCKNFKDDLANKDLDFYFSEESAIRVICFIENMVHVKGVLTGKRLKLEPWQKFFVGNIFGWLDKKNNLRRYREAALIVPRKAGKALAVSTPIPTPEGWVTMNDLKPGDAVYGPNSDIRRVVAATEVMYGRPCYEISFSDGSAITADAEHLWKIDGKNIVTSESLHQILSHNGRKPKIWVAPNVKRHDGETVPVVRFITDCKPVESVPVKCIQVDNEDGMYLCGETYIPTHNSSLAAAIGHYMLVGEKEKGSEVYCGATTEVQAFVLFNIARDMIVANKAFEEAFGLTYTKESIHAQSTLSTFKPIIGSPKDGSNPQCAIVDEYHEHPSDALYDSLKLGMGARQHPLLLVTTTAGTNIKGPCYRYVEQGRKVVLGKAKNDRLFYMEFTIDDTDKWEDFSCWIKASPNFGVSVSEEFLREQYEIAKSSQYKRSSILTKMLNVWNNESVGWIDFPKWLNCTDRNLKMEDFEGEKCWIGIDLASKVDLTAMVAVFKRDGKFYVFGKYYLPSDTVDRPENDHYRGWRDEGWLTVTQGARTDYHALEEDLQNWADKYAIQEVAYDPREAEYLMQNIREWAAFECIEFTQSSATFSEPMKEFEAAYLNGELFHQNDPILNFAAGNVVLKSTTNKLVYMTKTANENKIDPMVAMIMAIARAMEDKEEEASDPFIMFL